MSRVYDPVGKCIYCGKVDEKLSREHVIPYGMHGDQVLREASCKECASITSRIETYCLRNIYGPLRDVLNFPSRKNKEKRNDEIPINITRDGQYTIVNTPRSRAPVVLKIPKFPIAGALLGADKNDVEPMIVQILIISFVGHNKKICADLNAGAINITKTLNPRIFMRMIAKIAHSFAVAEFGVDSFEHLAVDLILDKDPSSSYVVGTGWFYQAVPRGLNLLSWLDIKGNIVIGVQLLAQFGFPTYHVVVGKRPGSTLMNWNELKEELEKRKLRTIINSDEVYDKYILLN